MRDTAPAQERFNVNLAACRRSFIAREEKRRAERERQRQAALKAAQDALASLLPDYPTVRRVYLFGSVVRPGAFRADSDVDIAVEGVGPAEYFALWRDLEEAMPNWTVDLRDLVPGTPFARRVQARGQLIYERENPGSES